MNRRTMKQKELADHGTLTLSDHCLVYSPIRLFAFGLFVHF